MPSASTLEKLVTVTVTVTEPRRWPPEYGS